MYLLSLSETCEIKEITNYEQLAKHGQGIDIDFSFMLNKGQTLFYLDMHAVGHFIRQKCIHGRSYWDELEYPSPLQSLPPPPQKKRIFWKNTKKYYYQYMHTYMYLNTHTKSNKNDSEADHEGNPTTAPKPVTASG